MHFPRPKRRPAVRTRHQADTGVYSLISPYLESEDKTPMYARVTLTAPPNWEGGVLNFPLLWDVNYPGSDAVLYVDGFFYGSVSGEGTDSLESWVLFVIQKDSERVGAKVSKGFSKVFNSQFFQRFENSQRLSLPNFFKNFQKGRSRSPAVRCWRNVNGRNMIRRIRTSDVSRVKQ